MKIMDTLYMTKLQPTSNVIQQWSTKPAAVTIDQPDTCETIECWAILCQNGCD